MTIHLKYMVHYLYWKEKETHIHFGCYLYQRCINCVNESVWNVKYSYLHTLWYISFREITCVAHVNGKGDRGYKREIQAVLNNRKGWFFKCSRFGQLGINWKLLNVNINIGQQNYAQCKFNVYMPTDVAADAASCSKLAAFILTLEKSEPKIWMHIKHCFSSAKAIPIQEA